MIAQVGVKPIVLTGLNVLIVEDEMMLMMAIEDTLSETGCILWKAFRVLKAIAIAETELIDCAVLDVNVAGDVVFPVAEMLSHRDIPFAFSSGYGKERVPPKFRDRPILSKPYQADELKQAILAMSRPHSRLA